MPKLLITGFIFLGALHANAGTFRIKLAECAVQKDINDIVNGYDTTKLTKDAAGDLSAKLPGGATATLHSTDSGFNVYYHTLSIELGGLKVGNTGITSKNIKNLEKVETTYVRTQGQINGLAFMCDVGVTPAP